MGRVARSRAVITFVTNEAHAVADDLRVLEDGAGWLPLAGESLVRVSGKGHREALQRVLSQPGTRLAGDNREFEVTSFPLW